MHKCKVKIYSSLNYYFFLEMGKKIHKTVSHRIACHYIILPSKQGLFGQFTTLFRFQRCSFEEGKGSRPFFLFERGHRPTSQSSEEPKFVIFKKKKKDNSEAETQNDHQWPFLVGSSMAQQLKPKKSIFRLVLFQTPWKIH